MKKIKSSKEYKTNYTSIAFCSTAEYSKLLSENKIDNNVVYFIDDSVQEIQSSCLTIVDDKKVNNVLGVPVKI